jgi:hypothetical protein
VTGASQIRCCYQTIVSGAKNDHIVIRFHFRFD